MYCVRLGGKNAFDFLLAGAAQRRLVGGGNVLGHVAQGVDARVDVFIEQVGAELRIQNATGDDTQGQDQEDGHQRNEQVRHNEAVAQAPKQPRAPPTDEAEQQVKHGQQRQKFQEAEWASTEAAQYGRSTQEKNDQRKNVEP